MRSAGLLALLLMLLPRPVLAADASASVPALVQRAITVFATEHRGALTAQRHLSFVLHAGPLSHDVRNDVGIAFRDGADVRTKYYSQATSGRSDDEITLRRDEQHANDELAAGRGAFKRPVDPRYTADYRFAPGSCDGCAANERAFTFTALVRDRQHGDGSLSIDAASGHVVSLSYELAQPPERAESASVVETFGRALPDLWTCVRLVETFRGRAGFLSGTATMSYTLENFHRFAQLSQAEAALAPTQTASTK
jgi:hypothetical protein